MGLFGGLKNAVQGFGQINPESGLSGADRLAAVGAILMGDPSGQRDLSQLAASRVQLAKKQQMQQQLAQLLGGSAAGAPRTSGGSAGGLPTLRDIAPQLIQLQAGGMDVSPYVNLLDKAGPQIKYERGMRYDERDPSSAPAFMPDLEKGQMPLFDADGRIVAVRNIDGSVQSAAEMAAAVEGAKARATAPYEFVNVPTPTGAPSVMSRQAAAGGVFTGQAPADALAASTAAKAAAEARTNLPNTLQTANNALQVIDQIKSHPGRENRLGLWSAMPAIPGTPGKDFDVLVNQAKGQVFLQAFESLKGAGQITEQEGKAAQAAVARLDQAQTPDGFDTALRELEGIIRSGVQRAQQKAGAGRGRPDRSAVEAELRRRGLIR